MRARLVLAFCFLVVARTAWAVQFTEDFDSGILNPNLTVSTSPGFGFSLAGGKAVVTQTAGTGNGGVSLDTAFQVLGDFTATVVADRTDLSAAEMGLLTNHISAGGFTDVFFVAAGGINANISVPPGFGFGSVGDPSSPVTFQIRRTGNSIFEEFDSGSGFQVLRTATHANLAGPVTVRLFLLQEFGSTTAQSGTFDDFSITADRFVTPVPEPSTLLLLVTGLAGVIGVRRERLRYANSCLRFSRGCGGPG